MDETSRDELNQTPELASPERSESSPTWDNHKKEDVQERDLMKNQDGIRAQKLKDYSQDKSKQADKKNTQADNSGRVLKFSEYFS